jgi:endonuclease YncB( thermonuclease family)
MMHTFALIILLALTSPAWAETELSGPARVVDGDTLVVAGKRVRFAGIDAPEQRQTCQAGTRTVTCGADATVALRQLIGATPVTCRETGTDKFGRSLAHCQAGGKDLEREMVLAGHALAYRRYSNLYVAEEERAKASNAGIWSTRFANPEDYRHGRPAQNMGAASNATPAAPVSSLPVAVSRPRRETHSTSSHSKVCGRAHIAADKVCHIGKRKRLR